MLSVARPGPLSWNAPQKKKKKCADGFYCMRSVDTDSRYHYLILYGGTCGNTLGMAGAFCVAPGG
jgi:hypothetical protein